jgi:hypothetical protein
MPGWGTLTPEAQHNLIENIARIFLAQDQAMQTLVEKATKADEESRNPSTRLLDSGQRTAPAASITELHVRKVHRGKGNTADEWVLAAAIRRLACAGLDPSPGNTAAQSLFTTATSRRSFRRTRKPTRSAGAERYGNTREKRLATSLAASDTFSNSPLAASSRSSSRTVEKSRSRGES